MGWFDQDWFNQPWFSQDWYGGAGGAAPFYVLVNHAGAHASSQSAAGLTLTTPGGYDPTHAIAGPRSAHHRSEASSSEIGRGYEYTTALEIDHVVVARADWLLTENGTRVRARMRDVGGTWDYVAGIDFDTLTRSDLLGPAAQDLVFPVEPTDHYGIGLALEPGSGTQATQIAKLYGSVAFGFGTNPQLGGQWQPLPPKTFARPLSGGFPYEVEARLSLTFPLISRAKATEFKALSQIRAWPIYLYDPLGAVWNHRLEHVLVEGWVEDIHENDRHTLSISFLRLKHYE